MNRPIPTLFKRFALNQSGATAIEYGLLAALLAVVIAGAVGALGAKLFGTFGNINNALK